MNLTTRLTSLFTGSTPSLHFSPSLPPSNPIARFRSSSSSSTPPSPSTPISSPSSVRSSLLSIFSLSSSTTPNGDEEGYRYDCLPSSPSHSRPSGPNSTSAFENHPHPHPQSLASLNSVARFSKGKGMGAGDAGEVVGDKERRKRALKRRKEGALTRGARGEYGRGCWVG
ncbi:hypothetical protein MMC30_005553 [Trapelia coarctata]|nr:hypothetical protein [Trapelia coarctata]